MKKLLPQSLFIATFLLLLSSHAASANYAINSLVDTNDSSFDGGAQAINNNGQIVGRENQYAFLWQNGVTTYLETLPNSNWSYASGINNSGTIVGTTGSNTGNHVFLWKNHVVTDLNPTDVHSCQSVDINDNEQVIEICGNGVLWQNGTVTDLGTLNGSSVSPRDINNNGQIVGYSYFDNKEHPFLWENGIVTDLGMPANEDNCSANSINDNDQIVIMCNRNSYLLQNGQFTNLGVLPGVFAGTEAFHINNNGQIVGASYTSTWDNPKIHPFLWQNGVMTDLGTFPVNYIENDEGLSVAINDTGLIAGIAKKQLPPSDGIPTPRLIYVPVMWTQANNAPIVGNITPSSSTIAINSALTASGTFTDDAGDTHTAVWNWGDNSTSQGTMTEPNGSTPGSVAGSHTYTQAGVYTVTLTVTDNGSLTGSSTYQYVSVYNPTSQGLFSAGQHYTSPAGDDMQNPSATGTVKFGLSYKYQGSVPTGNKEFMLDFKQGNLTFSATTVTSLVTANNIGTLRGTGTINGSGTYSFLVTGDGTANTVRIQIKDQSGNVIYDTQPGAIDTAPPTTSVTGNVIVHN